MVRKIKNPQLDFSDYPHKHTQLRGPWNAPHKERSRHGEFSYPHNGTDVTLFNHLPPPSHAYDPKILKAPEPYFGREGCDVTEYMRFVSGSNPPGKEYWHGREKTDVTEHLKQHIPAVENPLGNIFWGRPKSYVTDPSISPNLTPPGRPFDGEGSKDAMTWPAKSKEDQIPLGKAVSKLQSILNALARSQRKAAPAKPPKSASGPSQKRPSPGQPVGKTGKEFPPPGLKIKIPVFDNTYWGRTKSYITDYAISPNLTPPGRPLDGEGAKVAMTFVPITPKGEEKIPLGKSVKRMGSPRPHSPTSGAPQFQTGLGGPTRKLKPRPYTTSHPQSPSAKSPAKSPPPKSPPPSVPSSPKGKAASPAAKSPSKSPASPASSGAGSCKSKNQGNLRWRDQLQSGTSRPLTSPCCDKKQPRGPPVRPKIPIIKCPRPGSAAPKRKAMSPNLSPKIVAGQVLDPHHDVPWHGRAKNYVTDPSISPNLTPPGRQSYRTAAEKAASLARRPPKVPMIQPNLKPPKKKPGQKK